MTQGTRSRLPASEGLNGEGTHSSHAEMRTMLGLRTRPRVHSYHNLRHMLDVASISFPIKWDSLIALLTESSEE